jgi:hypothetical protein
MSAAQESRERFPEKPVEWLSAGIDESGRPFMHDGRLYRALTAKGKKVFDRIQEKSAYDSLVELGLIECEITGLHMDNYVAIVRHRKLELVSFCGEWPTVMLREAALTQCKLTRQLLKIGLVTQDAHPYNITFDFTRPVFLDMGSIVFDDDPHLSARWIREFRIQFYLPLWLAVHKRMGYARWAMAENPTGPIKNVFSSPLLSRTFLIAFNRLARTASTRGFAYFLDLMIEHLEGMDVSAPKSEWSDYRQGAWKQDVLREVLGGLDARTMIDLGANKGVNSLVAADMGLSVVATDLCESATELLYWEALRQEKRVLPLVMDVTFPTPPFGVGLFHKSSYDRLQCDLCLAAALVHHLAFERRIPFDTLSSIIDQYVRRYAFVEFIPPSDLHVSKWIRGQEDRFGWYTEHNFVRAFTKRFNSFRVWKSPVNDRKLFLFER